MLFCIFFCNRGIWDYFGENQLYIMSSKNTLIILSLLLLTISQKAIAQTEWWEEDFESFSDTTLATGTTISVINKSTGIWYDGGSNSYQSDSEMMTGSSGWVITQDEDPVKPYYGSIYTPIIDFSDQSSLILDLNYNVVDSDLEVVNWSLGNPGYSDDGHFSVEISTDAGESFSEVMRFNLDEINVNPNTYDIRFAEYVSCKAGCEVFRWFYPGLYTACDIACSEEINVGNVAQEYWSSKRVNLSSYLSIDGGDKVIIRIKSYITDNNIKVHLDDIKFSCNNCVLSNKWEDPNPNLGIETIVATSDASSSGRELFDQTTFDGDDWGIWEDGGRSSYLTGFLTEDVSANASQVCIRNFYSGKHNGYDDVGEDLGYQKPTYSSIYTENMYLTETEDLDLAFEFISYNMDINDDSNTIDTDPAITNEDGETIPGYVEGPDYVEISLSTDAGFSYTTIKTLTMGVDFLNLARQSINVHIPGDATPDGLLTTTTRLKIQCFSDSDEQQFYIDNIDIYKVGNKTSSKGSARNLSWRSCL